MSNMVKKVPINAFGTVSSELSGVLPYTDVDVHLLNMKQNCRC